MAMHPYAFVTCLGTGAPWREQIEDTAFDDFMVATFGSAIAGGVPSQRQDMEFSCAHPTRNGSNSLLKGASACYVPEARETPRIVFSLRGLWLPAGEARIIRSPEPGKSATKFWLAIRASEEVKFRVDLQTIAIHSIADGQQTSVTVCKQVYLKKYGRPCWNP